MSKSFFSGRKLSTALCAAGLLFSACQGGASRQSARQAPEPAKAEQPAPPAPEAHILVDEAMLKKPYAILGGTVENVGGQRLENLAVELELRRREDGGVERRGVAVEPSSLAPGEKGRYRLRVLSDEWAGSRLLRLRSGARADDVAFKSSPGARRPPERIPDSRVITDTKGARPRPRPNGEEFINTPDTAISVP